MRAVLLVSSALLLAAAAPSGYAQGAAASTPAYVVPASTPAHVRRAVESPERTAEQRARDYHRKPAEILTLSGIEEGDRVIELAAFGQYFTTMLVEVVGPGGHVDMYDLPYTERMAGPASRAFDEHDRFLAAPAKRFVAIFVLGALAFSLGLRFA